MDDSDEFSIVFDPYKKLCEKNNIKIGSDAWHISIQKFFSCEDEYVNLLWGSFLCLGYEVNCDAICNFDTFKDKVEIKENIINKMDKSIVDMNVGDIINFNANKLEAIFKPECDQKTQLNTGRINFFTDCLKSLILCLYVKDKFDTTDEKEKKEKEKKERLKQILIDTFLNMLVHLSLSPFLVNNYMPVDSIDFIKQFCGKEAFDDLHSKLYGYICKFLIKNADKPLNFQQQAEYIQQFLDITLRLDSKDVKLGDKIQLVDENSNIIKLDNGKIPGIEIKEKKLYFEVVDDRFKETIILNFNIFDDECLQGLGLSIDTRGNIKSVKEEDQLSSDELNNLNKLLLGTKLFSDKPQRDLICILFGIYLKRKVKINDITDDGIKDILKSFFLEMLKCKNKKSIMTEFKNLKAEKIPNEIYSQLSKIAICCDADSQENFWGKNNEDNTNLLDKIKIEQDKLKNNKDQLWHWIQSELFVAAINKKIGSNKKLKADLENAIVNDLPKDKSLFQSLDEFVTFLPTKLKKYFTKEKIREILGEEWGNFEIQDDYLEKLYEIDLSPETKTKIIKKFNMGKAKPEDRLKNENDVKKAIDTFKKILGKNKVSAYGFRSFIHFNISAGALSSKDMDAILDYVDCDKKENVFQGLTFWNTFNVLKEQPSKKFMEFMVKNTNFGDLDQKQLITNIIALMQKHPEYQKNNEKNGMLLALKDILCGKDYYQEFSSELLNVENIADKINDDNIAAAAAVFSGYIMNFVKDLMFYGIKIKLEGTDQNKKFTVCEEEYQCSNDSLIKLLSKEPELNNWLKDIFAKNEENKEITTLDDLVSRMSKADAIKKIINNSKNSERLKKIYKPLLDNNNLLNGVKLKQDTVEWCMREISSNIKNGSLIFDEKKIEKVKTSLESWTIKLEDNQKIELKINWLSKWKNDSNEQNTYKAISYMSNNNMLPTKAECITGYGLHDALSDTPDGKVCENFIEHISQCKCVDFKELYCDADKIFGVCLFKTIYQLIRTSKGYNKDSTEAQKQAIKNVLLDGNKYDWFRDGLKTFFSAPKENNKGINIKGILAEVKDLNELLKNCEMELTFDDDNGLTVQEEVKEKESVEHQVIINNNIINNNITIINNNSNSDNPYKLVARLGILLPIVPAIIFGIKIYNKQHKLTGGDIVLIIVGLFPIISAIVFGILAYKYNQNNLASEMPKNLKYAGNMDENDIKENQNDTDKGTQIIPPSSIVGSVQNQNQNQKIEE